ncbi:TPA: hypothetical protein ACH3X1_007028 [Trebouxia sp. C0004]
MTSLHPLCPKYPKPAASQLTDSQKQDDKRMGRAITPSRADLSVKRRAVRRSPAADEGRSFFIMQPRGKKQGGALRRVALSSKQGTAKARQEIEGLVSQLQGQAGNMPGMPAKIQSKTDEENNQATEPVEKQKQANQ